MAALREHRVRQLAERLVAGRRWRDGDYVFTTPAGQALDAANVQGEELAVVSRVLGQANLSTTADLYGHMTDAMVGRAAERTDTILGRRRLETA